MAFWPWIWPWIWPWNLGHMKFDIYSTTYQKIGDTLFFVWFLALLKLGYLMLPENNTVPHIDYNVGYNVMLDKYSHVYLCIHVCKLIPGWLWPLSQFLKFYSAIIWQHNNYMVRIYLQKLKLVWVFAYKHYIISNIIIYVWDCIVFLDSQL